MLKQTSLGPFVYCFSYIFVLVTAEDYAGLAMAYRKCVLLCTAMMLHFIFSSPLKAMGCPLTPTFSLLFEWMPYDFNIFGR